MGKEGFRSPTPGEIQGERGCTASACKTQVPLGQPLVRQLNLQPRRRLQPLQGPQQASHSVQGLLKGFLKVLVSLLGREHSHGARPSAKSLALPSGPCSESR